MSVRRLDRCASVEDLREAARRRLPRIASRALAPGDTLPTESELMGEFGVSRTVVREAISRLQAAGLVETRQGVGTFVLARTTQEPFRVDPTELATIHELISLLELRIALEAEAASLAAMRRSDAHLVDMRPGARCVRARRRRGRRRGEPRLRIPRPRRARRHAHHLSNSRERLKRAYEAGRLHPPVVRRLIAMPPKTLLITGASGGVGRFLRSELAGRYALRLSDIAIIDDLRSGEAFLPGDVARLDDMLRITAGVERFSTSARGPWKATGTPSSRPTSTALTTSSRRRAATA